MWEDFGGRNNFGALGRGKEGRREGALERNRKPHGHTNLSLVSSLCHPEGLEDDLIKAGEESERVTLLVAARSRGRSLRWRQICTRVHPLRSWQSRGILTPLRREYGMLFKGEGDSAIKIGVFLRVSCIVWCCCCCCCCCCSVIWWKGME